jgi:dipeptidyl aminopeptidase/acylaminoacyl peptidase
MGYAVLQPNFRGSTGYGQRFRGLNHGDILGKDWIDVNSGVDAMIRTGIADSTKMGLMGWSYGGFQTFWGVTQTRRFAAASSGAGVNDLTSFFSQTDVSDYLGMLMNSVPWDKPEFFIERSAYRKVKDVTTPLLIQSGDQDRRVSPEQSIQFYEAMKRIGKTPVKLVVYPGQGHGISDPRLAKDRMMRNVEWFSYWVPVVGQKPVIRMN